VGLKAKFFLIILSVALMPPLTIAVQIGYQLLTGEVGPEIRIITTRLLSDVAESGRPDDYSAFGILPARGPGHIADDGNILYASSAAARAAVAPAGAGPAATAAAVAAAAGNRDFYAYRFNSSGEAGRLLTVPEVLYQFHKPLRHPADRAALPARHRLPHLHAHRP
jgi:hypothetical protein